MQQNAVQLIRNATRKANPFEQSPSQFDQLSAGGKGMYSTTGSNRLKGIMKVRQEIGSTRGSNKINQGNAQTSLQLDIDKIKGPKLVNTLNPRKMNIQEINNLDRDQFGVPRTADSPTRLAR